MKPDGDPPPRMPAPMPDPGGLPNVQRLNGRVALVSQVGSALGRGCAMRFADEGATVVVVDPLFETALDVASTIESRGGESLALQAMAGSEPDIAKLVGAVDDRWGRLDVLFVTIGALDWWAPGDSTMELWEQSLRINLLTPIFYATLFRPLLKASGSGSVILYGSIDGIHGNPTVPAYSVARGGLIPFTHTMADAGAADGIRVNCIAGAAIHPSGPEAAPRHGQAADPFDLLRNTPLSRTATPSDIAGVASFLGSADSAYVTGSVVVVDGGRTAITPGTSQDQSKR